MNQWQALFIGTRRHVLTSFLPLLVIAGCRKPSDTSHAQSIPGQNILLVTLDTIRADRFGAYGSKTARTPAFDAIAARGVLLEDALAQVPLTLPSHCTLMTGRFPKEFGVRINNQAALGTTHPTLASILKSKGYKTAAFVSSFVLDSRFGLDRGFDLYDDQMTNVSIRTTPLDWERPANIATDRALGWLEANKKGPFFCWVHFFDPHHPYTPPGEFPKTYEGEVAFMDTQIKRFDDWLSRSGLRDSTLLIIVGDHGESFAEHAEDGHGIFLYQTAVHIPMVVAHPKLIIKPHRIAQSVAVADLFPTILELMEIAKPEGLSSVSFASALQSGQSQVRDIYGESEYVWHSYGWAQQRSITNPNWKFISSAKPELYDRQADPHEKINVIDKHRDVATELSNKLFQWYAAMAPGESGKLPPSAAATAALSALGYTGGASKGADEFLTAGADDPKDKHYVVVKYKTARQLWDEKRIDESLKLLRECAQEVPQSPSLQGAVGVALVHVKQYEEALKFLDASAKLDPTHQPALFSSGEAYFYLKQYEKAQQFFTLAIENDPNDPTAHFMLGETLLVLKKPDEAKGHFQKAVELLPAFPAAHFELGSLYFGAKDYEQAIRYYQETIRLEPGNERAHFNLGSSLLAVGRRAEAIAPFRESARLNPRHGQAWINLGLTLLETGQSKEGKEALQQAAAIPESAADAYYNLAIHASKENDAAVAAGYLQKVIQVAPTHPTAAWDLARDYLKANRQQDALAVLRAAAKANPSNVRVLNLLASMLATSSDDSIRSGSEALQVARAAAELTQSRNPMVLKTLAEAHAESGDFNKAISVAQQALALIGPGKLPELHAELSNALTEYQAQRPIRRQRFVSAGG